MTADSLAPTRRATCTGLLAGAAALPCAAAAARPDDGLSGASLFADVLAYERLGEEHRTGTPADAAGAAWLRRRLSAAGFETALQPFSVAVFEPSACRIALPDGVVAAYPAWPVRPTAPQGVRQPLAFEAAGPLAGRIAVLRLPYTGGGTWAAPGYGERAMDAIHRGASAVVGVTDGPTGELIGLNAAPGRFDWPAPVVLVAGRDGERLAKAARSGAPVTLTSTDLVQPEATAVNVVARRAGRGRTVVVSTPRSGWFSCASERGSGIAVFLAVAEALARTPDMDLVFVAASGHELGEAGQRHFLKTLAPPPDQIGLWLHIGANVACQDLAVGVGQITPLGRPVARRGVTASADLAAAAARAFAGQVGYDTPKLIGAGPTLGELEPIRQAGYARVAGMLGFGPLFHTRLDRATPATAPDILEPVARGALALARGAT